MLELKGREQRGPWPFTGLAFGCNANTLARGSRWGWRRLDKVRDQAGH